MKSPSGGVCSSLLHFRCLQIRRRRIRFDPVSPRWPKVISTEARADFERARAAQPSNPQVWLALTEVYAMQKDNAQRKAAAQRAVELAHAANGWESSASVRDYLGKVHPGERRVSVADPRRSRGRAAGSV